jgi:TusA-related sulfurtransferase
LIQTIQLDIHGQLCPSCLLLALKAMNEHGKSLRQGETEIVVMTDDRQATSTIPEAAARMGYRSDVSQTGNGYRIHIHV